MCSGRSGPDPGEGTCEEHARRPRGYPGGHRRRKVCRGPLVSPEVLKGAVEDDVPA